MVIKDAGSDSAPLKGCPESLKSEKTTSRHLNFHSFFPPSFREVGAIFMLEENSHLEHMYETAPSPNLDTENTAPQGSYLKNRQ